MVQDLDPGELFDRFGARALRMMAAGDSPAEPEIRPEMRQVSRGRDNVLMQLRRGDRAAAVKVFDAEAGRAGFEREVMMLSKLNGSGLSPRLFGYNTADQFVVMDWVADPTLAQVLSDRADRALGQALGQWFARFAALMPSAPADTDWYCYLSNYEQLGNGAALKDRRAELQAMPLRRMGIAKNDAYLANFLISPDGHLTGIDFGDARRKPLGWDILLTARTLHEDLGDAAEPVIDGMLDGWCHQAEGFGKAEFGTLVRLFLRALTLVPGQSGKA